MEMGLGKRGGLDWILKICPVKGSTAQIRSGLPGTARSCITMAERHVGARQRAFAVASSGGLTTVENRPVGGSEPVLHQRSDAVRLGAPRVPERVVAVDVAQDEDAFTGREAVRGAYSRTLLHEWYQTSPAVAASQSETRLPL